MYSFPELQGYLDEDGRRRLFCPQCGNVVDWRGKCYACGWYGKPAWMRSLRRHHRERIIRKRMFIWHNVWLVPKDVAIQPGKFAKYNLSCNCWMCRWEKKNGIEKPKYRWYKKEGEEEWF